MTLSPTQLTLRHLRNEGWSPVEVVEHFNVYDQRRHDLFGFIDVLAVKPGETLAVQTTTATNVSSRVRKIGDHPNIGAVREAGWAIRCHGWKKVKGRWQLVKDIDVS